jgi:DNA-directed RNA polymerase subunit RPC12/RpoP
MTPRLEDRLVQDFPDIFRDWHGNPQHTCMAWGIECPDGWEPAIRAACQEIQATVQHMERLHPRLRWRVVAEQVKEKFGSLRFYWRSESHCPEDAEPTSQELQDQALAWYRVVGAVGAAERLTGLCCADCGRRAEWDQGTWGAYCPECDARRTEDARQRMAAMNARRAEKEEADHNNQIFRSEP